MGCGNSKDVVMEVVNSAAETVQTAGKRTLEQGVQQAQRARNVFAKPLNDAFDGVTSKLPVFSKSAEEVSFLKAALPKNFCFEQVTDEELDKLVDSMEQISVQANEVVIQQGSDGDYFYVIYSGKVTYTVDGVSVGSGSAGDSFGELSLLYTEPRAATVTADAKGAVLYRVDQTVFRFILQQQSLTEAQEKIALLKKVSFLANNLDDYSIHKVANVMVACQFAAGTVIMKKGDTDANLCYILSHGSVTCSDVGVGDTQYQNLVLQEAGDFFGERALITGEPRAATVTATTEATCYTIDKQTFETVLGEFTAAISKASDARKLSSIKVISDSALTTKTLASLAEKVTDRFWSVGSVICEADKATEAALYLVRKGSVTIQTKGSDETRVIGVDEYFGDDQLLVDANSTEKGAGAIGSTALTTPSYTVTVSGTEDVTCGVLSIEACRKVLDTRNLGKKAPSVKDSLVAKGIPLASLKRHTVLGAGTFGIVFLVSRVNEAGQSVAYALKVQSKYELCKNGQAHAVVYEKRIMTRLQHPFLIGLVQTYQDNDFVYLLLQLVQGGELYSYIHTLTRNTLPESDSRFYAACIAEGLGFMHRNGFAYRDLKPENVLIDAQGYCVIIDFGFAKYVPDPMKTFTLCGTPLYLPPEVILNRGHSGSADHWSLGVLIYEMLTGDTPFYRNGMNQIDLFRTIVKSNYSLPKEFPRESGAGSMIAEFLEKNPAKRLGSLAHGEDDVAQHKWFQGVINFDDLRKKTIPAPRIPHITNPLDSSNFEDWSHLEDKTKVKYPKLPADQLAIFENF